MELCKYNVKQLLQTSDIGDEMIKKLIYQLINIVTFIHSKKIIHCDISTNNLLIDMNHNIKLTDFGLSEYLGDNQYIIKLKHYGTEIYNSPESLSKNKFSYKSDIYSVGIVIFELISRFSTEMERIESIKKLKSNGLN